MDLTCNAVDVEEKDRRLLIGVSLGIKPSIYYSLNIVAGIVIMEKNSSDMFCSLLRLSDVDFHYHYNNSI